MVRDALHRNRRPQQPLLSPLPCRDILEGRPHITITPLNQKAMLCYDSIQAWYNALRRDR